MSECISCLSQAIKDVLKENTHPKFHPEIDEFPTCGIGMVLQLCPFDPEKHKTKARKKSGEKRPPSAYNQFISSCMKSKPIKGKPFGAASEFMKECAVEWRQQKGG